MTEERLKELASSFLWDEEQSKELIDHIKENPWIIPIAESYPETLPEWEGTERIVEEFLRVYFLLDYEDITPLTINQILAAIKTLLPQVQKES